MVLNTSKDSLSYYLQMMFSQSLRKEHTIGPPRLDAHELSQKPTQF